jgi:hypothetical protein
VARRGGGRHLGSFAASAPDLAPVPTHASLASLSAMTLGIVLASLLVVRGTTWPLRRLEPCPERRHLVATGPAPSLDDPTKLRT